MNRSTSSKSAALTCRVLTPLEEWQRLEPQWDALLDASPDATPWPHEMEESYEPAAAFAADLAVRVLSEGMPDDTLLNVNVPLPPLRGVRISRLGRRTYKEGVIEAIKCFSYIKTFSLPW